mmetsp:Transcript_112831/g.218665  ORF Transcript_112831/g.218665 Transcript_112831/m.218665 type:complete len:102 (-) Transcript_112831:607-912(-)
MPRMCSRENVWNMRPHSRSCHRNTPRRQRLSKRQERLRQRLPLLHTSKLRPDVPKQLVYAVHKPLVLVHHGGNVARIWGSLELHQTTCEFIDKDGASLLGI